MALDGEFQTFPETRWSLVARAADADVALRRRAMQDLLSRYRPALLKFLVRSRGVQYHTAQDIVNEFITRRMLEADLLGKAAAERGRLRGFLRMSLWRFALDEFRKQRKDHTDVDEYRDAVEDAAADDQFDVEWARQILDDTYARMKAACEATGQGGESKAHVWLVFEQCVIVPTAGRTAPPTHKQIVDQYGLDSERQSRNALITATRMFKRTLEEVVGEYVDGAESVKQEIEDLIGILSRAGAAAGQGDS